MSSFAVFIATDKSYLLEELYYIREEILLIPIHLDDRLVSRPKRPVNIKLTVLSEILQYTAKVGYR